MRISILGSGSSGNCTFVGTEKANVLIDLGFGPRSLSRRLLEAGLGSPRIDAILLTHGHTDHVSGVVPFAGKKKIPVYMNQGTREEVAELAGLDRWEEFTTDQSFSIGDLLVEPFAVSHDSAQPVGFKLESQGIRGALATDLGELTPAIAKRFGHCDWLVMESNHDEDMLRVGPYPWTLKQRVLGRRGHLSNTAIARFLRGSFDGLARHLFLAHLSRQNNDPAIALESARRALLSRRYSLFEQCCVHLTHQSKPSIVLNL